MIDNKKGELTTKKLVTMIILILSFSILLFFMFKLNFGQVTDDQVCHNSVVLKGKTEGFIGKLDCKTQYLCISGGGDCLGSSKKIKVDPGNKDEILKVLADEMADCWWLFGEGELEYAPGISGFHCPICNSVKFSGIDQEITYDHLYSYLEENDLSEYDSRSYMKYLFDEDKAARWFTQSIYLSQNRNAAFSLDEEYLIITGRNNELEWIPIIGRSDKVLPVFFIKKSDLDKTKCTDYDITTS